MKKLFLIATLLIYMGCNSSKKQIAELSNPTTTYSKYPFLYAVGDKLYMSWVIQKPGKKNATLQYSTFSSGEWSNIKPVASGESWFVNWADFPSVIANKHEPMAAHWLNKMPGGTYAYNVNISVKNQSEWSSAIVPHDDGTATEHGFVSMIPWSDNSVLAVWLDGRQSANDDADDYFKLANAMTLRGAIISTDGTVLQRFLIDDAVCDCCQTSLIKTDKGALVAYRNRTEDEIRDIYVSRFDGKQWSKPQTVHADQWEIGACPVNGPKLAAGDSTIVVAWPTGAGGQLRVNAAISTDGGHTFGSAQPISSESAIGRVDAAVVNGSVYVSWIEKEEDQAYIKVKKFESSNSASQIINIAPINASRSSGFPQLEAFGGNLFVAWTQVAGDSTNVQTAMINLPLSE